MSKSHFQNLGFTFIETKSGDLFIRHHGKRATTLRGPRAREIKDELNSSTFSEQQQLMTRLTGNYKHGNERLSKNHPKNKH